VETQIEPLRSSDRATRIAVVDKLSDLLAAVEAELGRRHARIPGSSPARRPEPERHKVDVAAAQTRPPAPPTPPRAAPEISIPPAAEVDVALAPARTAAAPASGPVVATAPASANVPANANVNAKPAPVHAAPAQDSVDHMFRLFGRKGR
jgi:hypothetical protein